MKIQPILIGILALALLGACKSSTTVVENDVGIIQGTVAISDVLCKPIANGSGATVYIQGTGFSATTSANGQWQISNVPAGIYNIIITKPGFDTDLIAQYQFSGAGTQFLENQTIYATPLDSVSILSIQITQKDSIDIFKRDSVRQSPYDTIWWYVYDTVSYQYFVSMTFSMQGADSAVRFLPYLTDITHSSNQPDLYAFGENCTILRNANLTLIDTVLALPPGIYNGEYPWPGDSIVVTTTPVSPCGGGRNGPTVSRGFVLQ